MKINFLQHTPFPYKFNLFGILLLVFCFSCNNQSSDGWEKALLKKQVYLPKASSENMSGGFNAFVQHSERMQQHFDEGIEKYDIKHKGFHTDAIYRKGDLTEVMELLIKSLLPDKDFKFLPEVHLADSARYELTLNFRGADFHFKTSSQAQRFEIFPNLEELNRIAKRFYPDYQFREANHPNNHITIILFAKTTDLEKAVQEGFPCTLEQWKWKSYSWKKGIHPVIDLNQLPSEEALKETVLQELAEATEKGYSVPALDIPQIYLTDMAENDLLHIVINGASKSLNIIRNNSIHCNDDPWGLFLAYCLVKKHQGKVKLENPVQRKWKKVEENNFLQQIENQLLINS